MDADTSPSGPDWWLIDVGEDWSGARLDRFLRRVVPGLTQGPLEKMLRSGLIRLDGAKVKPSTRIETGQSLRMPPHLKGGIRDQAQGRSGAKPGAGPGARSGERSGERQGARQGVRAHAGSGAGSGAGSRARASERTPMDHDEAGRLLAEMLVAEGKDWLAINKPGGLAVQGGRGIDVSVDDILATLAEGHDDRMRLVHRIDKDTAGLVLVARGRVAARRLTAGFAGRDITKTYLALVKGRPPARLRLEGRLGPRQGAGGEIMSVCEDGQEACTLVERLDHAGDHASLVALRPLTGRKHQIRVHMAHAGHPVIGDGKYGGATAHPGGGLARRLHLHAWRLVLAEGDAIEAPVVEPLGEGLKTLGLALPGADWRFGG